MFDLRSLEHSTIVYETPDSTPLVRLAWNKQDANYLATVQMNSPTVLILDIRVPAVPIAQLEAHTAPISSLSWAPHSSTHVCSAGKENLMKAKMGKHWCGTLHSATRWEAMRRQVRFMEWRGIALRRNG